MRRTLRTTLWSLAAIGLAAAIPCLAQTEPIAPLHQGSFDPPIPTEQGVWDGTWFYVNRDAQVALWIRSVGKIEVRLRYHSLIDTEGFETDWDGNATYAVRGRPAEFHLEITEADANTMRGNWTRNLEGDGAREESAKVSLYRTDDGRRLAIVFEEFLRVMHIGDREMHITPSHAWTFVKASKRLVAWDEIPY